MPPSLAASTTRRTAIVCHEAKEQVAPGEDVTAPRESIATAAVAPPSRHSRDMLACNRLRGVRRTGRLHL